MQDEQGNAKKKAPSYYYLTTLQRVRKATAKEFNRFKNDPTADVTRFRAKITALKVVGEMFSRESELKYGPVLDELLELSKRRNER